MNGYNMSAILVVYFSKCYLQSFACLKLSPTASKSLLWNFIKRMENFLKTIKIYECRIAERKYTQNVRRWLYFFIALLIIIVGGDIITSFMNSEEIEELVKTRALPFTKSKAYLVIKCMLDVICIAACILPPALCAVLSRSLIYIFDEFYRYLKYRKNEGSLCLKTYIKEIREKYVTLSAMCCDLDNMLAYIFVCSYLTDILWICLLLRGVVIAYTTLWARLYLCTGFIPPISTLLMLSHFSSKLIDKVKPISIFVYVDVHCCILFYFLIRLHVWFGAC